MDYQSKPNEGDIVTNLPSNTNSECDIKAESSESVDEYLFTEIGLTCEPHKQQEQNGDVLAANNVDPLNPMKVEDQECKIEIKEEIVEEIYSDSIDIFQSEHNLWINFDFKDKGAMGMENSKSSAMQASDTDFEVQRNKKMKDEDREDPEQGSKVKKSYECSLCEFKSVHRKSLSNHLLTHSNTKLFKCTKCDYECHLKGNLKSHLLTHTNTKLFKCPECDYECNRKGHLKDHLLTHSNTKLFKCTECDYKCHQRSNLKIHLLTHSNTKRFKCPTCDYKCNRKYHLRIHSLTHLNTKLLKCPECDYECNQREHLRIHSFKHSNTKLFKCTECAYECNRKFDFKLHSLKHKNTS